MKNFKDLINLLKTKEKKHVVVAACEDLEVLAAVSEVSKLGLADFTLFGNLEKTIQIIKDNNLLISSDIKIINSPDPATAVVDAVSYLKEHNLDVLMKGLVDTGVILKEVLKKENNLRTTSILSHVTILEIPRLNRLLFLTDAAMNIAPSSNDLKQITLNAVKLSNALGNKQPKIAIISAVEKVNPKMASTVIANEVATTLKAEGLIIEGPMAVDIAVSKEAAITKNIKGSIQGDADILVVPYIEVGNALYKGIVFLCEGAMNAGIIVGAKKPIVLTSRADTHEAKVYSIILSLFMEEINE